MPGDVADKRVIYAGTRRLMVTRNLEAFLQEIRKETQSSGWLWIDAICINQDDVPERNQQVSKMKSIYQGAEAVNAWLGVAEDDSGLAFQMAECLYNVVEEERKVGLQISNPISPAMFGPAGQPFLRREWTALKRIFERSWWTPLLDHSRSILANCVSYNANVWIKISTMGLFPGCQLLCI